MESDNEEEREKGQPSGPISNREERKSKSQHADRALLMAGYRKLRESGCVLPLKSGRTLTKLKSTSQPGL